MGRGEKEREEIEERHKANPTPKLFNYMSHQVILLVKIF